MKVISLYSIKGGVGKTAASVNLAYLASSEGWRVLLCDLDPQGSTSYYFRVKPSSKFNKKKFIKGGRHITRNIKGTDFPRLDLLPADFSYRNLDIYLGGMKKSKTRLSRVLKPLKDYYDYIFIDSPPNITLLAENIFNASDLILVPLIPTTLSELSFNKLQQFFKRKDFNRKKLLPFFSMVEKRKKMHNEFIEKLSDSKPEPMKEFIPYNSTIEQMGEQRKPVVCFSASSQGSVAYKNLWSELRERIDPVSGNI